MSYWIRCRKDKIINSYILDRHTDPSNPVMKVTQDDKIPVYDSKADAEADLANIEEGGIVATKDTGATEKVVDVVEDGNMNPVTSNGVYDALQSVDITDQFSPNNTYVDGFHVSKFGKVIDIVFTTQRIDGSNVTGCLGLPIPRNGSIEYGIEIFGDGTITFTRIESNGTLVVNPSNSKVAVGHIIYISE